MENNKTVIERLECFVFFTLTMVCCFLILGQKRRVDIFKEANVPFHGLVVRELRINPAPGFNLPSQVIGQPVSSQKEKFCC